MMGRLARLLLAGVLLGSVLAGPFVSVASADIVNYQISAGGDDGYEYGATVDLTGSTVEVGSNSSLDIVTILRFQNVVIPQGATIVSATVTLKGQFTYSGPAGMQVNVYAEDVDNSAVPVATDGNIETRVRTSAVTAWNDIENVVADTDYVISVASQVAEVVARGGWSSGNALSVLIVDSSSLSSEWQDFYSYNGSVSKSAKLSVNFSSGATSTPTLTSTPTSTVSPDVCVGGNSDWVDLADEDTYITAGLPGNNGGLDFVIGWLGDGSSYPLLRFSVSGIPAGSTVDEAWVCMYDYGGSGAGVFGIARSLSSWAEMTVTGTNYTLSYDNETQAYWDAGSANGTALVFPLSVVVAQGWVDGGVNNGLVVLPPVNNANGVWSARELGGPSSAARLAVNWSGPTATPSDTPTSSNTPTSTSTSTWTATYTPSSTSTVTDTPTNTPTGTLGPTDTATSTGTATATGTVSPSPFFTSTSPSFTLTPSATFGVVGVTGEELIGYLDTFRNLDFIWSFLLALGLVGLVLGLVVYVGRK